MIRETEIEVSVRRLGPDFTTFAVRVAPLGATGLILVLAKADRAPPRGSGAPRLRRQHQLKTPVGALSLLAETINDASDDPDAVRRFASRMKHEADRLTSLIQDLITLSASREPNPSPNPSKSATPCAGPDPPPAEPARRHARVAVHGHRADPPRIDPTSEEIVLTFLQGGHNGGDLHFGPDGMLYISTGDAASPNPPDPLNTGQDISDLLSSILRIDVDHKDAGQELRHPDGQPVRRHEGRAAGGLGLRLPQPLADELRPPDRRAVGRRRRLGAVGDGPPRREGRQLRLVAPWKGRSRSSRSKVGPTPIRPPLIELPHTIACSVTGGYVYRGKKFPELRGAYVFGDWETRRLWAARFEGDRVKEMPEIARPSVRIVAFGEDNDGELYFLDYDGGTVHTLERNDAAARNADFPTKLSETGLFASVKDHTPAAGVVPFAVNSRQWQDGATAEHWVAFPGDVVRDPVREPASRSPAWWTGTTSACTSRRTRCWCRTLSLGGRRVETQLLHFDGVDWRAYTLPGATIRRTPTWSPPTAARKRCLPTAGSEASASGSSTAAASACRATATSRNTPWRSCPSN